MFEFEGFYIILLYMQNTDFTIDLEIDTAVINFFVLYMAISNYLNYDEYVICTIFSIKRI